MLSPLDFGLANGMLTEYMAFGSAGISKLPAKASSQPKAEWTEIPVPIASFYSNYSPVSQGSLGDFNYTTEEKISSNTGKYACAVTALFAIAGNIVYNNHFLINCTDWYNQTPDLECHRYDRDTRLKSKFKFGSAVGRNTGRQHWPWLRRLLQDKKLYPHRTTLDKSEFSTIHQSSFRC